MLDLAALKAAFDALHEEWTEPDGLEYGMAAKTIQIALGRAWWDANLELSSTPNEFARNGFNASDDDHWWYRRVVSQLADTLFELRTAEGFDAALNRFRKRPLRSSFFEAHIASQFAECGHRVTVIKESGVRGQDFDFQAVRNGMCVNVEVTETLRPQPCADALAEKLRKKVSQLPSDAPGILALVIPDSWATMADIVEPALGFACTNLFRRSRRINAVIVSWVAGIPTIEGGYISAECFRLYEHPSPRTPMVDLGLVRPRTPIPDMRSLLEELTKNNGRGDVTAESARPKQSSFIAWYHAIR